MLGRLNLTHYPPPTSLRPHIRLVNGAAVRFIFFFNEGGEISSALGGREQSLSGKLHFHIGSIHCRGKPAGELRNGLPRGFRWCENSCPIDRLVARDAG